jgi:Zn-dependent peptidase ImmA (M78 family)/transcriptional regulator with XRE-family HTH domain
MTAFNPERLIIGRQKRGMTQAKLAEAARIGLRSITAYEAGQTEPGADAVSAIAAVLKFPESFFFMSTLEMPSTYGVSFRALSTMNAAQRDAALAAGAFAFELSKWIEQRFVLPDCAVPDMSGFTPEAAADALRQRWQLGEQPIRNAIHLLESKGVRVFSLAEECREIDAYSLWRSGCPFTFLNTAKTAERSRHDAMHELGHLALHRHHGAASGRQAEQEADAFASAMLMPRGDVLARAPRYPSLDQMIKLKKRWNVSVASLARRLHQLKLLSDWHYRTICIQLAERGREEEPEPAPRETSQILKKAFDMARSDGITRPQLAAELGLHVNDLEALIFGLILTGVRGHGGKRERQKGRPRGATQLRLVKN